MNIGTEQNLQLPGTAELVADVLHGLAKPQKSLPCKWFYDEKGAVLFEEITHTPEYYLSRTETKLLHTLSPELPGLLPELDVVIEPGSGSSVKTRILLESLPQLERYAPLDISEEMLLDAAQQLDQDFPALEVTPYLHDFSTLAPLSLGLEQNQGCMVFFPGSTIGNFAPAAAGNLLQSFNRLVNHDGWLLIGVDTTHDKDRLLAAYNDEAGITAQFNKNILARINRELNSDFDIEQFEHKAVFNEAESRMEMHLVSLQPQSVEIDGHEFQFEAQETIHTENCYKYSLSRFESMANNCGWKVHHVWADNAGTGFKDILLCSIN